MPRGGKRPGAGRKKGYKERQTLDKEAARAVLRERVFASMAPMIDAQIAASQGIKYLVGRAKKGGKFIHLTAEQVQAYLARSEGEEAEFEVVEMWEKVPSTQAFTDLMDRALDKAAQPVQVDANVHVNITDVLAEARKRLNEAKNG